MNFGMIATGNHVDFDSLRGAPPSPTERYCRGGHWPSSRIPYATPKKFAPGSWEDLPPDHHHNKEEGAVAPSSSVYLLSTSVTVSVVT